MPMPQPATQPLARQVQSATRRLPAEAATVATVARFFGALGDPTRLRLLAFLQDGEHTVSECVAQVGLSQGRVSVHLACLADCGHVACRRAGRHAFYRVADPRVADLVALGHALAADTAATVRTCQRIDPLPAPTAQRRHDREATTP